MCTCVWRSGILHVKQQLRSIWYNTEFLRIVVNKIAKWKVQLQFWCVVEGLQRTSGACGERDGNSRNPLSYLISGCLRNWFLILSLLKQRILTVVVMDWSTERFLWTVSHHQAAPDQMKPCERSMKQLSVTIDVIKIDMLTDWHKACSYVYVYLIFYLCSILPNCFICASLTDTGRHLLES